MFVCVNVFPFIFAPVGWNCRIYRLLLYKGGKTSPTSVLDHDTNQSEGEAPVMLELGECRVPLHFRRTQVHSGSEW